MAQPLNKAVRFFVSEKEGEKLMAEASLAGKNMSEYVRERIRSVRAYDRGSARMFSQVREIRTKLEEAWKTAEESIGKEEAAEAAKKAEELIDRLPPLIERFSSAVAPLWGKGNEGCSL